MGFRCDVTTEFPMSRNPGRSPASQLRNSQRSGVATTPTRPGTHRDRLPRIWRVAMPSQILSTFHSIQFREHLRTEPLLSCCSLLYGERYLARVFEDKLLDRQSLSSFNQRARPCCPPRFPDIFRK